MPSSRPKTLAHEAQTLLHGSHRNERRPSPPAQIIVSRVIEYVDKNYAASITLKDVADSLGYSAAHLTNTFSRHTGAPVTAWIIRRRIRAAQQLLAQGDVPVAIVCEAVGFNDVCYFRRQFVRNVGTMPGRYRRTHAELRAMDGRCEPHAARHEQPGRTTPVFSSPAAVARCTECVGERTPT
jgi:transcriptional regulator GlxA family with amidase domain